MVQPEQAISRAEIRGSGAERTLLACAGAARKRGAPPPAPPHREDARRCAGRRAGLPEASGIAKIDAK